MKKTLMRVALAAGLGLEAMNAQAALVNGAILNIGAGSSWETEISPGNLVTTMITGHNGLVLGTMQLASGSHTGSPNGTESPNVDEPWNFFGNTGMHFSASATNLLSASGNTATVDFTGWRATWNGIASIHLGGNAWGTNPEGQAVITCAIDCSNGDTYSLYYTARVPANDPAGFGNLPYHLTLYGTVTAPVPLPAAAWLFGSALLGLVGAARRKKAA